MADDLLDATDPIDRILDAAYASFARHGVRRTTMDDIAAAAEMSRPAVYQYVRNKDDAFRRLGARLFDGALERASALAVGDLPLVDRVHHVLSTKLELTLQLKKDSPHAAEMLDTTTRLSGKLLEDFKTALLKLLADEIVRAEGRGEVDLRGADAAEVAVIALALLHGLEADDAEPDLLRSRLRLATELLVAGIACSRTERAVGGLGRA